MIEMNMPISTEKSASNANGKAAKTRKAALKFLAERAQHSSPVSALEILERAGKAVDEV